MAGEAESSVGSPEPAEARSPSSTASGRRYRALTALATAFAGLSTGELQKAMIYRSLAAQDQAKATSQWTLAGFKRDRALICQTAAAQLRAVPRPPGDGPASPGDGDDAAKWLAGQGPPPAKLPEVADEHLAKLLDDIRTRAPDADIVRQARAVPAAVVNGAIDAAVKSVEETDRQWTPTVRAAQKLVADAAQEAGGCRPAGRRFRAGPPALPGRGRAEPGRRVSVRGGGSRSRRRPPRSTSRRARTFSTRCSPRRSARPSPRSPWPAVSRAYFG